MCTIDKLQKALNDENADLVEFALYENPVDDELYVDLLIELLPLEWHFKHEDITRYLQQLKPSKAVEVLFKVATKKFKYLEFDNSLALARKCTWALADIGTDAARASLEDLAKCGENDIEQFAQKRLVNWDD